MMSISSVLNAQTKDRTKRVKAKPKIEEPKLTYNKDLPMGLGCFSASYPAYVITQKLDKTHYGAVATYGDPRRAIIEIPDYSEVEKAAYMTQSPVLLIWIIYIGSSTETLTNGFDVNVDHFKQCKKPDERPSSLSGINATL